MYTFIYTSACAHTYISMPYGAGGGWEWIAVREEEEESYTVVWKCHYEAHYLMLTKTIKIETFHPKKIENVNSVCFFNVFTLWNDFSHFLMHTFYML